MHPRRWAANTAETLACALPSTASVARPAYWGLYDAACTSTARVG